MSGERQRKFEPTDPPVTGGAPHFREISSVDLSDINLRGREERRRPERNRQQGLDEMSQAVLKPAGERTFYLPL